mgnify:CR=1 FL=1
MVTKEEARKALKTIAQYCFMRDCYDCEIKDACEKLEMKKFPFYVLSEMMNKE